MADDKEDEYTGPPWPQVFGGVVAVGIAMAFLSDYGRHLQRQQGQQYNRPPAGYSAPQTNWGANDEEALNREVDEMHDRAFR